MNRLSVALVAASAMVLSAVTANASVLNFSFSFSNANGTITGEIDGLSSNSTGSASAVIIDSYPTSLYQFMGTPICNFGCNTVVSPWTAVHNSFTVSNGQLTNADFEAINFNSTELMLDTATSMFFLLNGDTGATPVGATTATFSATPLPTALPLFATGLGAMGLFGWRRKRKNAAALAA